MLAEVALRANEADVLAYLVRRVDNREDAADLFGDAYLTAWRKRRQMPDEPEGARKWLFVIARNALLNHYRSSARRRGLTLALREELRESADDPTEHTLDVRRAISSLDARQAELVRLVHWEGFSIVDSAEIIGIPSSTARSRYAAARASLAKLLSASLTA